ncbi:MAG: type 4a pilus biogenesis protein PilO [Pseudobacteriovorax sp.]|nr:type 4a pilus biogenesis protein PilO [Pseudobacteriovorax sp.]
MEVEDIVDKYKSSPLHIRFLLVIGLGLLPSLYLWMEEGDRLALDLEDAMTQLDASNRNYDRAKNKVDQLPALLSRIKDIENQLETAKGVLPDNLHIDKIVSNLGRMENQFAVSLMEFRPGDEQRPRADLDYSEIPVTIKVRGQFNQIMQFYDGLVHMPNLTHLRQIRMVKNQRQNAEGELETENEILSEAKLILFKGL